MPGLKQLKKFSDDTKNLGNELKERQKRGEPVVDLPLPTGISEADDSDDFIMGLPEQKPTGDTDNTEKDPTDIPEIDELSGITGVTSGSGIPDIDSIDSLIDEDNSTPDLSGLDPELAKFFMDPVSPDVGTQTESPVEPPAAPVDSSPVTPTPKATPVVDNKPKTTESEIPTDNLASLDDLSPIDDLESLDDLEPLDDMSPIGGATQEPQSNKAPAVDNTPVTDDVSTDDELPVPDEDLSFDEAPVDITPPSVETVPANNTESLDNLDSLDSFDMPDVTEPSESSVTNDFSISEEGTTPADSAPDDDFSMPDFSLPEMTDDVSGENQSADLDQPINSDEPAQNSDVSIDDFTSDDGEIPQESFDERVPVEDFSSAIPADDLDFDNVGDSNSSSDDEFSIPGFSDFALDDIPGSPDLSVPDFSAAASGPSKATKVKNAITDNEYKSFLENLKEYPLNLRIALEDFISKNEFTDEAVLEVIEKVVKKVPARQVAAHLEKLLDTTISVPRDFERRTVAQYEAYKSSIEYQLKNRIIPGLIVCCALAMVGFILFFFINRFIYRPIKAEQLYKEGYTLLENSMYPQSEMKFSEAVAVKSKKKWFFAYARGYRERKQYDRSRNFYERLLERFNYDKTAGLEYADMEFSDLSNYEKAEEITRRKVLDYHINDKDGLLLLGDIFLEWGTEKDSAKLDDAFNTYCELIDLYGNTDVYASRLLRYYIRTDNLREVLPLKAYFLEKKKALGAEDLVELSGYMLDKLYGDLPAADEYLRDYIEDVRELLERAVTADASIPESQYNLGRYFLYTGNNTGAESYFKTALDAFDNATERKSGRIRKNIDTYRMLGELYSEQQEYLLAEATYGNGIELYETESEQSAFKSDSNIGKLYSNIADIDYFISGDLDQALRNYINATNCQYDTPSVNYRIGYIHYQNKDYDTALRSFVKTITEKTDDNNVLLALGNVLSIRKDNYAAQGYYDQLLSHLEIERKKYRIMFPQVNEEQGDIVDLYMKAENNLGVTLSRLAKRSGDSSLNAEAMVHLAESTRAWDALTRNQTTMIRLEGSNLAQQNIKYLTFPNSTYEPAIYTTIPTTLVDEKVLTQPAAR